jgi:hypothetical protein
MQSLRQFFTVRDVAIDAQVIEPDVQVLIVAHPQDLSDSALYAIDQYMLKGGKALVIVDPHAETSAVKGQQAMMRGMPPMPTASDLDLLFAKWGVKLAPDVVHVCHILSHTTALLEVTRRLGIPTFATLTDFFGFCYNNVLEDERSQLCAGPDTLRANCIACLLKLAAAQPHADALTRLGGMPYLRTKVADVFARLGQREANAFSINGFAPRAKTWLSSLAWEKTCSRARRRSAPSKKSGATWRSPPSPCPTRTCSPVSASAPRC